jgi:hypothetical protein
MAERSPADAFFCIHRHRSLDTFFKIAQTVAVFVTRRMAGAAAQGDPEDVAGSAASGPIPDHFPYRNCNTSTGAYQLVPGVRSLGAGKYCFNIQVNTACKGACCAVDLKKIEVRRRRVEQRAGGEDRKECLYFSIRHEICTSEKAERRNGGTSGWTGRYRHGHDDMYCGL